MRPNESGENADYIPSLRDAPSDRYGLSIMTVDGRVVCCLSREKQTLSLFDVVGQQFSYGDTDEGFSIQSCHKPLNYALALEEHGVEEVHKYVGTEPSGVAFNAFTLLDVCCVILVAHGLLPTINACWV